MVGPIAAMAIIEGVKYGSQLLGIDPASKAIKREQEQASKMRRRRSQFASQQGLMELLGQQRQGVERLGRSARNKFQAGISSFAQDESQRIAEALATAGVTGASDTAARQTRGLGGDIVGRQLQGDVSLGQFEQGLRQQHIGSIGQVMNLLYPSAGQLQQQEFGSAGQYTDPLQGTGNLLSTMALLQGGGGSGNANTPSIPNQNQPVWV